MIIDLPLHLFYYLQEFVVNHSKDGYSYKNEMCWRKLINTSKKFFKELKRETIYFRLNKYHSVSFLNNPSFRQAVGLKVKEMWKQIGIDLSYTSLQFDLYDLSVLNGVHYLDFSYTKVTDIHSLHSISELHLNCTAITDISSLREVTNLDLTGCLHITDYSCSPVFQNPKLEAIKLAFCTHLINISFCASLRTVNLARCENIYDVSMLGNVYDLNLSGCLHVYDVSKLGKVHILDLSRCSGVTDISALHSVHTLYLYSCPNIRVGLDCLMNVHEFHISRRETIALKTFSRISKLFVSYCSSVDASSLMSSLSSSDGEAKSPTASTSPDFPVSFLSSSSSSSLSTSCFSRHLQEINLDHCETIDDLSALSRIPTVSLKCCDKIANIDSLTHVKNLTLLGCERIFAISFLKLKELIHFSISFCHGINEIEYQTYETHLSTLVLIKPKKTSIEIAYCDGLNAVKVFNDLYSLTIVDCSNLSTIDIYGNIQYLSLKLSQEPEINIIGGMVKTMKTEEIFDEAE
jgi:hypothetical protein